MQLGNGRWETAQFNARLQVTQIGLGTNSNSQDLLKLRYDYGQADNNGSMRSQEITVQGQFVANQTFTYDGLNRLQSSHEASIRSRLGNRLSNMTATAIVSLMPRKLRLSAAVRRMFAILIFTPPTIV
ncbi:MAG: hypothetical protein HC846_13295 [Blastocatellia bacterium]|nr:hypothetical protein [Blastocatellia bacterium]